MRTAGGVRGKVLLAACGPVAEAAAGARCAAVRCCNYPLIGVWAGHAEPTERAVGFATFHH